MSFGEKKEVTNTFSPSCFVQADCFTSVRSVSISLTVGFIDMTLASRRRLIKALIVHHLLPMSFTKLNHTLAGHIRNTCALTHA